MTGELPGPAPGERSRPTGRRNALGARVGTTESTDTEPRRTVVTARVNHEPGVLSKVSGLFARRQFNIESLTVGPSAEDGIARMTIVVEEPDAGVEQVKRHLRSEVSVRSVHELGDATERELALVTVAAAPDEITDTVGVHGGYIAATSPPDADGGTATDRTTVEVTGTEAAVDAAITAFEQFGVCEIARTGTTAVAAEASSHHRHESPQSGGVSSTSTDEPPHSTRSTARTESEPTSENEPTNDGPHHE